MKQKKPIFSIVLIILLAISFYGIMNRDTATSYSVNAFNAIIEDENTTFTDANISVRDRITIISGTVIIDGKEVNFKTAVRTNSDFHTKFESEIHDKMSPSVDGADLTYSDGQRQTI